MDIDGQKQASSLPEIDDSNTKIDDLIKNLSDGTDDRKAQAKQLQIEVRDFREATVDAVRHYAGLATAGQMSGLVFRQLGHPIRQMRSDLSLMTHDLAAGALDAEDIEDLQTTLRRV